MPHFGTKSRKKLNTCHPDLILIAEELIRYTDVTVIYGKRSKAEQDQKHSEGFSKVAWPFSAHNCPAIPQHYQHLPKSMWPKLAAEEWPENPAGLSRAIDLAPWPVDWGVSGDAFKDNRALQRFAFMAGMIQKITADALAKGEITHGIKWGGHFRNWSDLAHFELVRPSQFYEEYPWFKDFQL